MIEGTVLSLGNVCKLEGWNVLGRADSGDVRENEVAIVSGGGSGHE